MSTTTNNKVIAIIVAAGRGLRVGDGDGPKQYLSLGKKSLLGQTLEPFLSHPEIAYVQVVIHHDDEDLYTRVAGSHVRLLPAVFGGSTRQASVRFGLEAISDLAPEIVLIHDAARPFTSIETISRVIEHINPDQAALPVRAVADTLKRGNKSGLIEGTVSRENLYAAQTPQGFPFNAILAAHRAAEIEGREDFTDDAALAEWVNLPVRLVEGNIENTKITTADDLERARAMISIPDIRTGHGYDTHQLVDGTSLWLCGVEIAHDKTLKGHSDADVGLHALTDALLGCIGAGDIGSHFPPSDPKWKGARSDQFLAHAARLVRDAGGTITHCDVTLVCEAPKIGPRRDTMREAIGKILLLDVARVSVKATTNERIGFVGREEGIVALATATCVITDGPS